MAILIDINCLHKVFCVESVDHKEFKPILDWIVKGNGIIVYGGTKYQDELKKTRKFHRIFKLYFDKKKVYIGDAKKIDSFVEEFNKINHVATFNDVHLLGIIINTKCKLVCTVDKTAIRHLKNSDFYPDSHSKPKFYKSIGHKSLLCDKNIPKSILSLLLT